MPAKWCGSCLLLLLLGGMMTAWAHVDLSMQGDRVNLTASGATLREIMEAFDELGVRVKMDPSIEKKIEGHYQNQSADVLIQQLAAPYGSTLVWKMTPSPLGSFPALDELRIYRQGFEQQIQPIHTETPATLAVINPTGTCPMVADEILLAFRPGTTWDDVSRLLAQIGATIIECDEALGIYRIKLPANSNVLALQDMLSRNPTVFKAEPNYVIQSPDAIPSYVSQGLIRAGSQQPSLHGAATVAVLDSGLAMLSGMDGAVAGSYNALNPDMPISDPVGHGTQMALLASGLVVPAGSDAVNPSQTPVLAIQAFDANGNTSNFDIMRSIQYAHDNGARVLNLSWGTENNSAFLEAAMNYAHSLGLIVVAAAGNEPTGQPVYPAAYASTIAIAATNPDGSSWDQSNYGDFIDFAAPGIAQFPIGHDGPAGTYAGSSISSADVAHWISVYLSAHPEADAATVYKNMKDSVYDAGPEGFDPQYGYGILTDEAISSLLQK